MKKQTLILVVIGVILFIAGSAIAYASVKGASKSAATSSNVVAPVSTSAVVAKANIPAGTTGQAMISEGLVALQLIPTKSYTQTDLNSLSALQDEVLTSAVTKGDAISSTDLNASTSTISLPTGMDAITVTLTGPTGWPDTCSRVATSTCTATSPSSPAGCADSGPPAIPCTELALPEHRGARRAEYGAGLRRASRTSPPRRFDRPSDSIVRDDPPGGEPGPVADDLLHDLERDGLALSRPRRAP